MVPVNPPAIPGLGVTAGFQIWIEQKGGGNYEQLSDVVDEIIAKAQARPELAGVNTTIRANGQQLLADVDREKAEVLGVAVQDAYNTLQTMFGSLYVSQFPKDSRLYQVVLQAEPEVPDDARGHRPLLRQEPRRRDGSAVGAGHARATWSVRTSSRASTTTRRSRSTARRRRA